MDNLPALSLLDATIIHTEKYNDNGGFVLGPFVQLQTRQEIIFRMPRTGGEINYVLKNETIPLYPGQEVRLVVAGDSPLAFIVMSTGNYYLLDDDLLFTWAGQPGVNRLVLWIGAVLLAILAVQVLPYELGASLFLILFAPLGYHLWRWWMNSRLERQFDAELRSLLKASF